MRRVRNISLSKTQKIFLSILVILCFIIRFEVVRLYRRVQQDKLETAARSYGESVATAVSLSLNHEIYSSAFLRELYEEYDSNFVKDFDIICDRLMKQNPEIGSLFLAPNGIISVAYPRELENRILGFNMLDDPVQGDNARTAIATKRIVVAGPYKLREGGAGYIIKNPVFKDDRFHAFVVVIVDAEKFTESLWNNISIDTSGYKIAAWKESDDFSETDDFGFIFNSSDTDVSRLVSVPVMIPNDEWYLAVEPVDGWKSFSSLQFELLMTFLIVFVPVFSVYLRQKRNAWNIYIAQHDDLTDMLSRTAFYRYTERLIAYFPDQEFNIIATDIENFKVTNSMYGTEKCDEILIYLANRLYEKTPYGLCTRFSSDHFIFVMPCVDIDKDFADIEEFAKDVIKHAPIDGLSVKFGFYGKINKTLPVNLICDKALLAAKSILHHYDKLVANYDGPLSTQNIKSQILESSFLDAIKNRDFKIWFQPKYDAVTEQLVGAEALVRWIKPDGTLISPIDFIHVFEDDGLIYKLDLYVFETVCKYMKEWQNAGFRLVPVSINISRTSLQHKNVIKEYNKILRNIDLSADYVPLEITESSTSVNNQIKQLTEDLKLSGFKIHMDDFGTGLSSLESLNLLPFDVIKLDKSLIDFIGTPVGEELLRHTVELIQFMNLKTIAEGVENIQQLEFLRKLNCDYIQGYYFAAPMPYEKFDSLLRSFNQS